MDLLILGAGVRAAAWSALRTGLVPHCADLFADRDLAEACPTRRIEPNGYPDDLLDLAEQLSPRRWMYTGALENRPDLIGAISIRHRLLGNSPEALRAVRDPLVLARVIREAGLDAPEVTLDPTGVPVDGSWLLKPLSSGGGRGIRPWRGQARPGYPACFQRRIDGISLAAIFLAEKGGATCLGVSRQFVGRAGRRFAYRGSMAPWPLSAEARDRLDRLGTVVASASGLVGLFGIDVILAGDRIWPIEVNPRYTASVEVLEWVQGRSFLAEHLRACDDPAPAHPWPGGTGPTLAAKAILFADRERSWPEIDPGALPELGRFPELGDIPELGARFGPGQPVVTVFASGESIEQCRRNLATRLRAWRRRLVEVRPGC